MFRLLKRTVECIKRTMDISSTFSFIIIVEVEVEVVKRLSQIYTTRTEISGVEPTGTNQRKILNGAEKLLRLEASTEGELDRCLALQSDFFTPIEIERFKAEIGTTIESSVVRRKPLLYEDSVWIAADKLPPSSFHSGASLFICRFLDENLGMLPFSFSKYITELQELIRNPYVKIEVLCGSGYEWHKFNGEILPGSVSVKKDRTTQVFIGRGRISNELHIGPVFREGKMRVCHSFSSRLYRQYKFEEIDNLEILVANNVKSPFIGTGIPNDAIFVGVNEGGHKTYLGKAWYRNDLLPAKVVSGYSFVSHAMQEVAVAEFEYVRLDPGTYQWEQGINGNVPENAINGGCTKNGETLYFGRVLHEGIYIPGKVHPSRQIFCAPYRGQEIRCQSYEVLVSCLN